MTDAVENYLNNKSKDELVAQILRMMKQGGQRIRTIVRLESELDDAIQKADRLTDQLMAAKAEIIDAAQVEKGDGTEWIFDLDKLNRALGIARIRKRYWSLLESDIGTFPCQQLNTSEVVQFVVGKMLDPEVRAKVRATAMVPIDRES